MTTYDKLRLILCFLMIAAGILYVYDTFFMFAQYTTDFKGRMHPVLSSFRFRFVLDDFLTNLPMFLYLPLGVYFIFEQRTHFQLLPRVAMAFAVANLLCCLMDGLLYKFLFSDLLEMGISLALIFSACSFYRGHYHSATRIMLLCFFLAVIDLLELLAETYISGGSAKLINLVTQNPHVWACILLYLYFMIFAVYPDDFPSSKLHKQLQDTENTSMSLKDLLITRADLASVTGSSDDGWGPSGVPGVSSEVEVRLYGSRQGYSITARRWAGDEGIYISVKSSTAKASSWGKGFRLVWCADDNTVSSVYGRPVRLYSSDGTFMRLVAVETKPKVRNKYKSALARFFEE